jgi:hypothetical protein
MFKPQALATNDNVEVKQIDMRYFAYGSNMNPKKMESLKVCYSEFMPS